MGGKLPGNRVLINPATNPTKTATIAEKVYFPMLMSRV
jgi:hypothetical protein